MSCGNKLANFLDFVFEIIGRSCTGLGLTVPVEKSHRYLRHTVSVGRSPSSCCICPRRQWCEETVSAGHDSCKGRRPAVSGSALGSRAGAQILPVSLL